MNNFEPEAGYAALEAECSRRAMHQVRQFAQDGLSIPEQIAIALNMLAISIVSGVTKDRWDDIVTEVSALLRDNVRAAVIRL